MLVCFRSIVRGKTIRISTEQLVIQYLKSLLIQERKGVFNVATYKELCCYTC